MSVLCEPACPAKNFRLNYKLKTVVFVESGACRQTWLTYAALRDELSRHSWLFFVGDSDTRVFVYEVLQVLAAGAPAYSAKVAAYNPGLWLGEIGQLPAADAVGLPEMEMQTTEASRNMSRRAKMDRMRRCLLDFSYADDGRLVASRSVHCRSGPADTFDYVALGVDYNLSALEVPPGGTRITYIGTARYSQTMATLATLRAHLSSCTVRPSALYAGISSWMPHGIDDDRQASKQPERSEHSGPNQAAGSARPAADKRPSPAAPPKLDKSPEGFARAARALVAALDQLAELMPAPRSLVLASVVGMANRYQHFDPYLLRAMREKITSTARVRTLHGGSQATVWRLFDRTSGNLYQLTSASARDGASGLRTADGHAPPLVNLIDLQRLVLSGALRRGDLVPRATAPAAAHPVPDVPRAGRREAWADCTQATPTLSARGDGRSEGHDHPRASAVHGSTILEWRSSWCAGFPPRGGETRGHNETVSSRPAFMEAMYHFCEVRVV